MKIKFLSIIVSVLTLMLTIFLCYFATDIGYMKDTLPVTGIPGWVGTIIMCLVIPPISGNCFYDYCQTKRNI